MTRTILVAVALLAGCSTTSGQLFCAIDTGGGGTIVAGLIDATATAEAGPIGGPVAVIATNATAAVVQADCTAAAKNVGGKGAIPVSPVSTPATIAITPGVK